MTTHRMTIIHRVPDIDAWRSVMERTWSHDGFLRRTVFQSIDDPNEVMIELEFDSADAARAYLPGLPLRELSDEIGLEVYPPVFVGTEISELSDDASS